MSQEKVYSDAISHLEIEPNGGALATLFRQLYVLLDSPDTSEGVRLIGRYLELLAVTPTWDDLPFRDRVGDIRRIYSLLADPQRPRPFITTSIKTKGISKPENNAWLTIRTVDVFAEDAVTGLTAMMIIIGKDTDKTLARSIGAALRGRKKRRKFSIEEKRAYAWGKLHVETPSQVLSSLPLARSSHEQYALLVEHLDRIQEAKPSLAEIIRKLSAYFSADIAGLQDVDLDSYPLDDLTDDAAGDDEEFGDEQNTYYADLLDSPGAPRKIQRAYHQQAIWSSNQLLLEGHVSALTHSEASNFTKWLLGLMEPSEPDQEPVNPTALGLIVLILITGRTLHAAEALLRSALTLEWTPYGRVEPSQGKLLLPALMPEKAYRPKENAKNNLLPVSSSFWVDLPPPVARLVRQCADPGSIVQAQKEVSEILSRYRKEHGWDISLGRMRQYLATRVTTIGKDPAITHWITGDSHGHSMGYLHYAHVEAATLASAYARAVWPLFCEDEIPPSSQSGAVGSMAVPRKKYVKNCVQKLNHRFNSSKFFADRPQDVADRHNLMTTYVASMLTAVSGHRISGSLLELKRGDFCLSVDGRSWQGVATYSDKRRDSAHHYRPVPLGKHVAEQIGLYLLHLHALLELVPKKGGRGRAHQAASSALDGSGPLFFWLSSDLTCPPPKFSEWHQAFQDIFPDIPSNFGRHYLAHKLRLKSAENHGDMASNAVGGGELACLALGHFPVIGNPFGKDSPTDIISMAEHLGPTIDEVYQDQQWQRRGGLAKPPKRFSPRDIPPRNLQLKSWDPERESLDKALRKQRVRIDKKRREKYKEQKELAAQEFMNALHMYHPKLAEALLSETPQANCPLKLSRQELTQILTTQYSRRLGDESQRQAAISVKLVVARKILRKGQNLKIYQGPLPSKIHKFQQGERTPLLSGMYRAYETLLRLRSEYPKILADDLYNLDSQPQERLLGHIAVSCILYGQVSEQSTLEGLINNFLHYQRSPAYSDSVLIELQTHPPATWALWGVPAALVVRLSKVEGLSSPPSVETISDSIWDFLPETYRPQDRPRTLELLLETAAIVANIELSGIARLSLGTDPGTCSWSIDLARQLPFLENTEDLREKQHSDPQQIRSRRSRDFKHSSDWLEWLRAAIPTSSRSAAKTEEQLGEIETNRRRREPAKRAIEQEMSTRRLNQIEQALGFWTIQMLMKEKKSRKSYFAPKTVSDYLAAIGDGMLSQIEDREIAEIEHDEWLEIYENILEGSKEGTLDMKLRQVRRLHRILRKRLNAGPLPEECLPVAEKVKPSVRNSLALPIEIKRALEVHERSVSGGGAHVVGDRELLQAYIAFVIMAATGCRIGEVSGLNLRDIRIEGVDTLIRIRLNDFRRIKSQASGRIVPIKLTKNEASIVQKFLDAEQQRKPQKHRRPTRIAFLDLSPRLGGIPIGTETLRPYIASTLRQASPVALISYDIRKARGTILQAEMGLSPESTPKAGQSEHTLTLNQKPVQQLRLPRWTFSRSMVMGHARPRTTTHSYGGMPWVFLAAPGKRLARYLEKTVVGSMLNIDPASAARALSGQSGSEVDWILSRLDPTKTSKDVPKPSTREISISQLKNDEIPSPIIYLLGAHDEEQELTYPAYGITDHDYGLIKANAKEILDETRFAVLFSLTNGIAKELKSGKPPRWYRGSQELFRITREITDPKSSIWDIASAYRTLMTPTQKQNSVILPGLYAQELERLIGQHDRKPTSKLKVSRHDIGQKAQIDVQMGDRNLSRHLGFILCLIDILSPLMRRPKTTLYQETPASPTP